MGFAFLYFTDDHGCQHTVRVEELRSITDLPQRTVDNPGGLRHYPERTIVTYGANNHQAVVTPEEAKALRENLRKAAYSGVITTPSAPEAGGGGEGE